MKDRKEHRNRLAQETSPYLLQHASNPVDWYPWGEEAFALARENGKPVLLSIGYSACHWCHVMAHESFEDPEIGRLINEGFVAVKVDREERPDIDAVYMTATQAMTGQGGWPLTVFATPDGQPFFCGTYFPRQDFLRLLGAIATAWRERRTDLLRQGEAVVGALTKFSVGAG
ncbi:MAG TPA: thioredoxin domain-containing protein, partial [Woeseiaceae bacterium]|nr:thioredoxin domain-containing protein [Woeseiaceae bacterium]